jgi:uncharacterized protein YlxW (UPF0749 family)
MSVTEKPLQPEPADVETPDDVGTLRDDVETPDDVETLRDDQTPRDEETPDDEETAPEEVASEEPSSDVEAPERAASAGADEPGDAASAAAAPGAWGRIGAALRPRFSRSEVLAGVLCAALGFALVVQVRQSGADQLSSLRQDDLVRLLDEVTVRADELDAEVSRLEETRDDLRSGTGQAQAALELAEERAESEGILSGRLPAEGPGVTIDVVDPQGRLQASQLFNVLEELRNAGAEAVEVNGVRLVTTSWFADRDGSIVADDQVLEPPYRWTVIGDPATMDRALEIPGGALATIRTAGGDATTNREDLVTVDAVIEPEEPEFATPQD